MNEASLKGALVKELNAGLPGEHVVFRFEDIFTHGIPDLQVVWNGVTTIFEVKYAHPRLKLRKVQHLTCMRLELAGRNCWYLIYHDTEQHGPEVFISKPSAVHRNEWMLHHDMYCMDFNHRRVVDFVRRVSVGGEPYGALRAST